MKKITITALIMVHALCMQQVILCSNVSKASAQASSSNINAQDNQGQTALFKAVADNNIARTRELLGAGANPSIALTNGMNPLIVATIIRNFTIAEDLLGAGANPNAATQLGSALHFAPRHNSSDTRIAARIIDFGGDCNLPDTVSQLTPLHVAAGNGQTEHVQLYLQAGAKKDARTNRGQTPADIAATEVIAGIINRYEHPAPNWVLK